MKLTEDLEKDTISNFVCIKNIEPIEEAEDLHGAERVEDMRVVPHVPPEPTCTATSQEDTQLNHLRTEDPNRQNQGSPLQSKYQIPGGSTT